MELISITAQTRLFILSCGMGFLLGVIYDVFRVLRALKKKGRIYVFFLDFLYCAVCTLLSFFFILAANKGEVRWYILFGELLGWIVYYTALADITAYIFRKTMLGVKRVFTFIFRIVMFPFKPLISLFKKANAKFVKNARKSAKKLSLKSKNILQHKGKV